MKLTGIEKGQVIEKLKDLFETEEVSYNGSNRFVVRQRYSLDVPGGTVLLFKDKLFDENCQAIPLSIEYNGIFPFIKNVATVCIRENIQLKDHRVSQVRKDGLIDKDGKELLPCIYDSVKVNLDGSIEVTKDKVVKISTLREIVAGDFDWDDAITRSY